MVLEAGKSTTMGLHVVRAFLTHSKVESITWEEERQKAERLTLSYQKSTPAITNPLLL
jgi:hypothetical protein